MKKIASVAIVLAATLVGVAPAQARGGCGAGFHRGEYGHCRPNIGERRVAVLPGGLVIGRYYNGRGYWDGRRYWQHRERHERAWRYR